MDERQDEMDEMEAKRKKLMNKQKKLEDEVTLAKGWHEAKQCIEAFTKKAAESLEKCAVDEMSHKADDIDDTVTRFNDVVEQNQTMQEVQSEKLEWLAKQIEEADARDEEETEAEM